MYVKKQFKRASPKRIFKHFEKSQSMVRTYSAEKNLPLILSAENIIYTCLVASTHLVYNKVYNHQLFSISINFTCKFCYWHRPRTFWHRRNSSRFFMRKNCSKRFCKNCAKKSATFIKLYVDIQQIYKN